MDLEVPVIKSGRITDRKATVFCAFEEQLIGQMCLSLLAQFLPAQHFELVSFLAQSGRLTLPQLQTMQEESKSIKQKLQLQSAGDALAQVCAKQLVVREENLVVLQQKQLLEMYLKANSAKQPRLSEDLI